PVRGEQRAGADRVESLGGDAEPQRDPTRSSSYPNPSWPSKEDRSMVKDFRVLLILCLTVASWTLPAAANEVVQWNETTMKAIEANGQASVVATRTLAMVQVAVHDALNAISRRYDAYYFEGPGDPAASPDAAVAAAAHTVLVGVVGSFGTPVQKVATLALVDQAYAVSIARVTDGPARNKGAAIGRAAGAAILALRKDDGATRDTPYTPAMGAGKWRPHPNPVPPNPPIANADLARGYLPSSVPGWANV